MRRSKSKSHANRICSGAVKSIRHPNKNKTFTICWHQIRNRCAATATTTPFKAARRSHRPAFQRVWLVHTTRKCIRNRHVIQMTAALANPPTFTLEICRRHHRRVRTLYSRHNMTFRKLFGLQSLWYQNFLDFFFLFLLRRRSRKRRSNRRKMSQQNQCVNEVPTSGSYVMNSNAPDTSSPSKKRKLSSPDVPGPSSHHSQQQQTVKEAPMSAFYHSLLESSYADDSHGKLDERPMRAMHAVHNRLIWLTYFILFFDLQLQCN